MAYGSYRLQFLHISDIHGKGPAERELWRRRRVLGDGWRRNLETILEEEGPLHFVLFTGDAAHTGDPAEYDELTGFFTALCDELQLGMDRLFLVPGNHDIRRSVQKPVWESMRSRLGVSSDLLGISRWMNGFGGPPLGFAASWKDEILERQSGYRDWVRSGLGQPDLVPDGLGFRRSVTLPLWQFPIHIVGLDTSWLCGDNADAGHLLVTENQAARHLYNAQGASLPGLRLVLMHHPLHELADKAGIRRLLSETADLVLRGHLHQTELSEWIDPDRRLRELAVGSLYEGGLADTYGNSCQFVRLELSAEGRPIEAAIRFRTYSPRAGHWYDDNSVYQGSRNGRTTWTFSTGVDSRKPNPFSPWDPKVEQCFGRTGVFQRLEAAFDERRSVWLVGDWRIGKSMVLLAWEKRLRERGIVTKLVSGQGPAGVSAQKFVQAVTGLDSPADADGAANRLTDWINAVSDSGVPPVLLVDEVESIVQTCDVRFFDRLRDLIGRVCLVFSSQETPDEVFAKNNKTSPITNKMEAIWIGLLEPGGADATIRIGAEMLGPGDAELMRQWCGDHSFFLQLLGRSLVEARRRGASPGDGLAEFQQQANTHLRTLWRKIPPDQQSALRDAARGLPAAAGVLHRRGLVDVDGGPFGEVFAAWLRGAL